MSRRDDLLAKLKSRDLMLTKAESDELGPVNARELAPETGDQFVDEMLLRATISKIKRVIAKAEAKRAGRVK